MGCANSVQKINPTEVDLTHFDVESVIGQGGFGKVQCVSKKQDRTMFAMKTMSKADSAESSSGISQVHCYFKRWQCV
jgi:hypothetical protein